MVISYKHAGLYINRVFPHQGEIQSFFGFGGRGRKWKGRERKSREGEEKKEGKEEENKGKKEERKKKKKRKNKPEESKHSVLNYYFTSLTIFFNHHMG